ncbi:MAG: 3-isopropylmalate dehydratase small subunit [Halanaerobiaceae bacterium]
MKGKVFKYGDNVDTDQIYPGRYLELTDPENIASHALEGLDSDFTDKVKKGDIIAGGKNFGCGSSREHAVICLKESGVGAIVAESFARIFYRNAINMGLPLIEVSDLKLETGDVLTIKLEKGVIEKENKIIKEFKKLPENILDIIKAGGVINYYLHKNK